jgi:hypothetical protein
MDPELEYPLDDVERTEGAAAMPRRGRRRRVECVSIEPENELIGVGQNMITATLSWPEGRESGTSDQTSLDARFESASSRRQSRRRQGGTDKLILVAWWKRRANGPPFKKVARL